jgi:hypothetical protein
VKLRILMMVSVVAAGCGGVLGDTPWDKNHDGLVGECEGLNRAACAAAARCHVEELACIAL